MWRGLGFLPAKEGGFFLDYSPGPLWPVEGPRCSRFPAYGSRADMGRQLERAGGGGRGDPLGSSLPLASLVSRVPPASPLLLASLLWGAVDSQTVGPCLAYCPLP